MRLSLPLLLWASFAAIAADAPPAAPAVAPPPAAAIPAPKVTVKALATPAPEYPKAELNAGHEGRVQLRLDLNREGTVQQASVLHSSGWPALDQAALDAAKNWKFTPPLTETGEPTTATVAVPLNFSAQGTGGKPDLPLTQEDMQKFLKQPCSSINDEVAEYRRTQPDGKLADLRSFRTMAGVMFLASYSQSMDARVKLWTSLSKAWPIVVDKCAATPSLAFDQAMADSLKQVQAAAK